MARYTNCKKGVHRYSSTRAVGGGIARRICSDCGLVQIDLSDEPNVGDTDLFTEPKLATMFEIEALLAHVADAATRGSFGGSSDEIPRPARAFG